MRTVLLGMVIILPAAGLLAGCEDHLAVSPCRGRGIDYPGGIAGTYEIASIENAPASPRVEPTTQRIRLVEDSLNGMRVFVKGAPARNVATRGLGAVSSTDTQATVSQFFQAFGVGCKVEVDGRLRWILGSRLEHGTWALSEIVPHTNGFFIIPHSFRRDELDRSRIPWTPRVSQRLQDAVSQATSEYGSSANAGMAILIDNRAVPLEAIVRLSRPGLIVQNFSRVHEEGMELRPPDVVGHGWRRLPFAPRGGGGDSMFP